jgi:hypothetical protein
MSDANLLSKLNEKQLRDIVKNEKLTVPDNYRKKDLIKYLEGTLTLQKIKLYTLEAYERTTEREIIRETIKEKGMRLKTEETTSSKFNKRTIIKQLGNEKIHPLVLKDIAHRLSEPTPKGKGTDIYDTMSNRMLEYLDRVFIKKDIERQGEVKGLFLEFKTANFIKQTSKLKISEIKVRKPLSNNEIDVVGFDTEGNPVAIAECKDRAVKKEDLDKWLANSKKVFQNYKGSLIDAYFVTSKRLTDGCLERIMGSPDVDADKGQLKMVNGILERGYQYLFNDDRGINESGRVKLSVYEVRQNEFNKVFPKK